MPYTPHTSEDIKLMLKSIGINDLEELFKSIPKEFKINNLNIASGLSEHAASNVVKKLSSKNKVYDSSKMFLGAGAYSHYIPSAVNHITLRSEFYTAYTPYQPEVSQGTLQAIFEFQTMMCRLTGMDISNASMYDGATALAESVLVAYKYKREKKKKILVPSNLHPEYLSVMKNYLNPFGMEFVVFNSYDDCNYDDVLTIIIQNPDFYGNIDSKLESVTKKARERDVVSIYLAIEATSLGLLKSPGELGFDISVLEIQTLGNPIAFGGPHAGVITAKKEFMRNLPGRIVGETKDANGERAFVLTLATREQHIRREKATSNICSNQALVALRTVIYLTLMGENGLKELAKTSYNHAHYLKEKLNELGLSIIYNEDFYNEFLVKFNSKEKRDKVCTKLKESNILSGLKIDEDKILVAVTELNTKDVMDKYVEIVKGAL